MDTQTPQDPDVAKVSGLLRDGKYSLQQIREGLTRSGYAPGDVDGLISRASETFASPTEPRFLDRSGVGGIWDLLKGVGGAAGNPKYAGAGPLAPAAALGDVAAHIPGALMGHATEELKKAFQSATKPTGSSGFLDSIPAAFGNALEAGGHVIRALPGGDSVMDLGKDADTQNYPGMAGDLTALAGPQVLESLMGKAAGKSAIAGLRKYRSELPFDVAQHSAEDIESATRAMLKERIPAQEIFSEGADRTLDRLGDPGTRGTVIGNLETKLKPYVTGTNGAKPVNAETLLAPILNKLKNISGVNTQAANTQATNILSEVRGELGDLDPIFAKILDPKNNYSPEFQTKLLDAAAKGNYLSSVAEAHTKSRALNNVLNEKSFSDTASNVQPGQVLGNKLLRQGFKDSINEVHPEVADLNNHYHDVLTAKQTLEQVAKQPSRSAKQAGDALIKALVSLPMLAGGAAGWGAHVLGAGPLEMGIAGGASYQAIKALQDPGNATRAAILLGNDFPKALRYLKGLVPPAGTLPMAAQLGHDPVQQLFNPPGQTPSQ